VFAQECKENGWLDNAFIVDTLVEYSTLKKDIFSEKLALIGFEEIAPQQKVLCDVLKSAGLEVIEIKPPSGKANASVVAYSDRNTEIKAAAALVRSHLQKNTFSRIGMVIPKLHGLRTEVLSIFEDVLMPGAMVSESSISSQPFSLSLGQSLIDYPLVKSVFSLFAIGCEPFAISDISTVLRCSFVKGYEEEKIRRFYLMPAYANITDQIWI